MNDNNLLNLVEKTDKTILDPFLEGSSSNLTISTDFQSVISDLSWLEKTEDGMLELDKIIRNPKKFIVQEEEVVPISKTKQITLESIKHLAVHTNLIQDYDEAEDSITPSHLLNIHKEESFDIYENRFINTLLQNLYMFLRKRKEAVDDGNEGAFSTLKRDVHFEGQTKINHENIKVTISLETKKHEDLIKTKTATMDINDRVERLMMILHDYMKSPFIAELANAEPVRSPIRKTNIILKNQSFLKALELWEMIEAYDFIVPEKIKEKKDIEPPQELKNDYDLTFYLNYMLLNSLNNEKHEAVDTFSTYYLNKLIEDYADKHNAMDRKKFASELKKQFANVFKKKDLRLKKIDLVFKNSITQYEKDYMEIIKLLKSSL